MITMVVLNKGLVVAQPSWSGCSRRIETVPFVCLNAQMIGGILGNGHADYWRCRLSMDMNG